MLVEPEQSFACDALSESDISELELAANSPEVFSDDEPNTSEASSYDSESSYDPSIMTEDEEFIDDSNDSENSDSSSDFNDSNHSDNSDNSDISDDSDDSGGSDDSDGCNSSAKDMKQELCYRRHSLCLVSWRNSGIE
jgi:hypothetical protein